MNDCLRLRVWWGGSYCFKPTSTLEITNSTACTLPRHGLRGCRIVCFRGQIWRSSRRLKALYLFLEINLFLYHNHHYFHQCHSHHPCYRYHSLSLPLALCSRLSCNIKGQTRATGMNCTRHIKAASSVHRRLSINEADFN